MKLKKFFASVLALSMIFTLVPSEIFAVDNDSDPVEMPFLTTQGSSIVDSNGNKTSLRGTNLSGWLLLEGWMTPLGYGALDRTLWETYGLTGDGQPMANYQTSVAGATDDNVIAGLKEGDLSTIWQSTYAQGNRNMEFKIEFDRERTFSRIVIKTGPNYTSDYVRSPVVLTEKNNWAELPDVTVTTDTTTGTVTLDFSEQTAKYVVIKPTEDSECWWAIADINVCVSDEYSVRRTLTERFGEIETQQLFSVYQDNWITPSDIRTIADMNMNFVRVPVHWLNFANWDGTLRTDENSGFQKLDWLIEECRKYGIYVLIDFHGAPGGSNGWASSGQAGQIPTELFMENDTSGSAERVEFNQETTLRIWEALATRYKDESTIAAYGLLNEPVLTFGNDSYLQNVKYDFYNDIYQTVRSVDSEHIVVFEEFGDWSIVGNRPQQYGWDNYMFEKHPYDMANNLEWDSQYALASSIINDFNRIQSTWNIPLIAGEFCLYYFNDIWDYFLSGMNSIEASWTNWCYKVSGDKYESGGGNWGYYNTFSGETPDILNDSVAEIEEKWSDLSSAQMFEKNTSFINTVAKRADGSVSYPYLKLDNNGWSATASNTSEVAGDNPNNIFSDSLRWSTGLPQQNGQWLLVDLGEPTTFDRIELIAGGDNDYPEAYRIQTSDDGIVFEDLALDSVDIGFGNKMVLLAQMQQTTQYIKISLTESGKTNWWSVQEFNLYKILDTVPEDADYKNPNLSVDVRVADLMNYMTLEEKIGQLLQVERSTSTPYEIQKYAIGSVLSGGGSAPTPNTPEAWADMVDGYQQAAMDTRLGIPLLYGVDAVHGHNNVVGTTIFPHNIGLGAVNNSALTRSVAESVAKEVRATGVNWTFAPCLAAPQDYRWGRTYEGFSENPEIVSSLGAAYILGLQGDPTSQSFLQGESVVGNIKHYLGDGNTVLGNDQGDVYMDTEDLETYLQPYEEAVQAGARTVMVSLSNFNGSKMHANKQLITNVLKDDLGFTGIVVSDWNGAYSINNNPDMYWDSIKQGLDAGIDMFMEPWYWKPVGTQTVILEGQTVDGLDFIGCVKDMFTRITETGNPTLPMSRLDDAVTRILRVKFEAGLFEEPFADRTLLPTVGSTEHRDIARDAVRQSATLLKNSNDLLPLSKSKNYLVVGEKADNIGYQCGGWTVAWQGSTEPSITEGTTILQGIIDALGIDKVDYSTTGIVSNPEDYTAAIVVIGEEPYAEMMGDVGTNQPNSSLSLSSGDQQLLNTLEQQGIPAVVVMLSGRPMNIAVEIQQMDALVAAWLPGTEGAGVSDVLFGDYPFTGTLPLTWLEDCNNTGDNRVVLFPQGFSITTN